MKPNIEALAILNKLFESRDGRPVDSATITREDFKRLFDLLTGEYVPAIDGERYRAIRDKGIAFSAWQDENGVQWAVNGRVGKDLDVLVDEELLKRDISGGEVK